MFHLHTRFLIKYSLRPSVHRAPLLSLGKSLLKAVLSRPPKPRAPPAVPMEPVQPPISSPLHPEGEDENPREIRGRRSFASSWQGRKGMQSKWMWAIGRKASHGWKGPERTEGKWAAAAAASRRAFLWDKRLPLAPPGDQGVCSPPHPRVWREQLGSCIRISING